MVKLTYFYLIDLTDVTLAPEDANSKLFNVVSVAESDVDDEERVGDSLDFDFQYIEAEVWWRFPLSWSSVEILKLKFGPYLEINV